MRTAIGLLALGIAGGVVPVGFSVMPYLSPLLVGTVSAFLMLLTLGLVIPRLRHRGSRASEPASSRPARRPGVAVRSARHSAT